jgi:hypothetical protein
MLSKHFSSIWIVPLLLLLVVGINPPETQAEVVSNGSTSNRLSKLKFPRNGAPIGRRRGGARRDDCLNIKPSITALVPGEETLYESTSFTASTVSDYPTFWVYLPKASAIRNGEFVFQDENSTDIYRTPLTLSAKAGVIGIDLPHYPQYALKTDNKYQWYFKVFCDSQKKSNYVFVKAWVQRISPASIVANQFKMDKSGEYFTYAVNLIWQDAITKLAEVRVSSIGNSAVNDDWRSLLKSVGLEDIASAPIIARYRPQK